jgi:hypothetical protein
MLFKGQQFVVLLGVWALVELAVLTLFQSLDYVFFFVIAFLGFLVLASLASPYIARPRWRLRLNYVAAAGALAFCAIVAQRALEMWRTLP